MAVDLLNIEGLEASEHQGPIVMVNLMRFRDRSLDGQGSGWDAYLRYSALTVPMIKARGGTLLWTGQAKAVALGTQAGNQWDYVALVYYPSVAAFIDMMTDVVLRTIRRYDLAGLPDAERSAPPQRMRRACNHRHIGSLQQVQGGLELKRIGCHQDLEPKGAGDIRLTRSDEISPMLRMPSSAMSRSTSSLRRARARCTPASPAATAANSKGRPTKTK